MATIIAYSTESASDRALASTKSLRVRPIAAQCPLFSCVRRTRTSFHGVFLRPVGVGDCSCARRVCLQACDGHGA
eukprot:4967709-Lingulodinium_polyedra.AAC.1